MDLASVVPPGARVLEIGATDGVLARALERSGLTSRYLGLVPPEHLAAVRSDVGDDLAHRVHPLTSPDQAIRNSTDVLVLRGRWARALWAHRDLHHVGQVVVERSTGAQDVERRAAALAGRTIGRLRDQGHVVCDGIRLDVYEVPQHREPAPRTYFSPVWGPAGLAERLKEAGLRYAVLRWFETLPDIAPGEDLDVLVADDDTDALRALLESEPGVLPVDLYSASGLDHSDFQGAAYYPPPLATGLLDRAVVHTSGFLVPAPEDHLRSLAYHAVYHKGPSSGFPSVLLGRTDPDPEHDYPAEVARLAAPLGASTMRTLEDVDDYLAAVGWRPPLDALRRFAPSNPWIEAALGTSTGVPREDSELTVFLVRRRTLATLPTADVLDELEHVGFDVVEVIELDDEARARTARSLRGGNWGQGPFPVSGGDPVVVVAALHHDPDPPGPDLQGRYPHLTNAEVVVAKQRVRRAIEARTDGDGAFNPIHSSDNEEEAWEYLEVAVPDAVERIRADVDERRAELRTDVSVLRTLSRGRRARVEIVAGSDGPVVRKTFARGFLRFMEREVWAMRELSGLVDAVPPVLDSGPNWFTCPFYDDVLGPLDTPRSPRLVPLPVLRQMVVVLRRLHELGYDLVDAKPQNFVVDRALGLRIVDFEFMYRYEGDPPPLERSATFVDVAPGFAPDRPVGDMSYDKRWLPYTGMPLAVLLDGSEQEQRSHRRRHRARSLVGVPRVRATGLARRAYGAARGAKGTILWRYTLWARWRARSAGRSS
ncbi:hypothetical protein [Cellulosimicrobium protaetiae]|uniref:Protein kinase domain-containing protein n=1 Tax=Cellulosimicrobium protaetiae TaxID=2587808 RepID=A0A6M5UFV5_9MICO|nr:hypothetical protein [Cellulosimicrobium protaetiae]QJW35978.1 hypothetical protein FIC82_006980 [Cellulosimicrobium protaetiae]